MDLIPSHYNQTWGLLRHHHHYRFLGLMVCVLFLFIWMLVCPVVRVHNENRFNISLCAVLYWFFCSTGRQLACLLFIKVFQYGWWPFIISFVTFSFSSIFKLRIHRITGISFNISFFLLVSLLFSYIFSFVDFESFGIYYMFGW